MVDSSRPSRIRAAALLGLCAVLGPGLRAAEETAAAAEKLAGEILQGSGLRGGLIVHLACGDGKLTAALRGHDGIQVHGLDADPTSVRRAREHIRSLGLYGPVSVDRLRGSRLPYVDNLVNLVVLEEPGDVPEAEIQRVLCPGGVAYRRGQGRWTKTVKPRPEAIDEWTHYLHDASNNAVSTDTVVGPPRRLQWVGSPRFTRHHDRMSSVSAVVSAGGRVFYIMDEGSRVSILLPAKWSVIARDAFNGTILWKRRIDRWHTHLWPLKSGPAQLARRLVASADRVYVTLSLDGPLVALDAATGETVRSFERTRATEEVILSDGVLFLLVNEHPEKSPYADQRDFRRGKKDFFDGAKRTVTAVDPESGEVLWSAEESVLPSTLAAKGQGVFFHDGRGLVRLDRVTGKESWRSEPVARVEKIQGFYLPTLVVHDGVVLFSGGETAGKQTGSWYTGGKDTMTALSARSGEVLWTADHPPSGYRSPEDLLVVNGLVWTGETTSGRVKGVFQGRDPRTGEVKVEFPPDVDTYWFHHRCYRGKATSKYLLMARTGTEFIDIREKSWTLHHWFRGGCMYGVMPANGLVYAPPHPCACYLEAKLSGFNALAAPPATGRPLEAARENRLEKGPAFGEADRRLEEPGEEEWPTYRHDAARSGATPTAVPARLKPAWRARPGGRLTSPVVAGGRVLVASIDTHTVHALDAASGERLWHYTAGARIDSPPTIHEGRVYFGSTDGRVYSLRASDGELAWCFRAALLDERLMSLEQLESVWPVHGSVLIENGVLYCVSGRSMFLDGGLRLYRLDPRSGRVLSETELGERDPQTGKGLQDYVSWLNMPATLPDVLSSDGRLIYMRSQPFRPDGTRLALKKHPRRADADQGAPDPDQDAAVAHLFCPTGFLDDSWWHRSYWMFGSMYVSGWQGYYRAGTAAPSGRILVFDDSRVYGFGRKPQFYRWTVPIEHHLFAADRISPPAAGREAEGGKGLPFRVKHHWTEDLPILARALVLAGGTLFVAGPPDLIDEPETFRSMDSPRARKGIAEQAASIAGERGASLLAFSAAEGKPLGRLELDDPPVFDGLIAAGGKLYLSTTGGELVCLGGSDAR